MNRKARGSALLPPFPFDNKTRGIDIKIHLPDHKMQKRFKIVFRFEEINKRP